MQLSARLHRLKLLNLRLTPLLWSRTLFQFVIDRLNSDGYVRDYFLLGACEAASGHDARGTLPIVFLLTVACTHLFVYGLSWCVWKNLYSYHHFYSLKMGTFDIS